MNYMNNNNVPVGINELDNIPFISARSFIDNLLGMDSSELTPEEIIDFRLEAFRIFCEHNQRTIIMKVHDAFPGRQAPGFFAEDFTAGIIYIVRNPLDVAVSLAYHLGESFDLSIRHMNDDNFYFANDTRKFETQFPQKLKSWSGHVNSWLKNYNGSICLIRYEDLLDDPYNTFKKILSFMKFEIDNERLEKAIKLSSFHSLKEDEVKNGFREKSSRTDFFFREGKAGTWNKYLNSEQANRIINNHHDVMLQLNYLNEENKVFV